MSVKSAKAGSVNFGGALSDVTDITVNEAGGTHEYASSSTNGQVSRIDGHDDKTGSFTMLADAVGFSKGDSDTLVVKSDADVELFNGTALILDISYAVPVREGSEIEAVVNWGQKPA